MADNCSESLDIDVGQLYKQGLSCKDIASAYKMPILSVRAELRALGFDTRSYRKVSAYDKDKVILLIKAGYSYSQIENLLHFSTHLIRGIVEQNGMVGCVPKNHPPIQLNVEKDAVSLVTIGRLRDLYFAGTYGLSKCAKEIDVSDDEFMWFVYHLTGDDILQHRKLLISRMKCLINDGLSVATAAKMLGISPAIVKRYI